MAYATDSASDTAATWQAAKMTRPNIPNFTNPPVAEVALSVQFEELTGFGPPQIGLLWQQRFREHFPLTEQHVPLPPQFEIFGVTGVEEVTIGVEMLQAPPLPRCWFLNESRTELIQVQTNRFIHNWREVGSENEYPRYEPVRARFEQELNEFRTFVEQERLGKWSPTQCEITYVNPIVSGLGWQNHGEIGNVLTVFKSEYSDGFLSNPEDIRLQIRYTLKNPSGAPFGRLHVSATPGYRRSDGLPLLELTLTARGTPSSSDIEGVLAFLDLGRETIVQAFASITTPEMHRIWGRTQ
jgi:uncharacterized protein (TIGR04255 family)